MTDEEDVDEAVPEAWEVEREIGGDGLLRFFIGIANSSGAEFGVTLYVGGAVISGKLVNGRTYYQGLGDAFESAKAPEVARDALADGMRELAEDYPDPSVEADDEREERAIGYVHLRDAAVWSLQGPMETGTWWRGRIERVDAFQLGELGMR